MLPIGEIFSTEGISFMLRTYRMLKAIRNQSDTEWSIEYHRQSKKYWDANKMLKHELRELSRNHALLRQTGRKYINGWAETALSAAVDREFDRLFYEEYSGFRKYPQNFRRHVADPNLLFCDLFGQGSCEQKRQINYVRLCAAAYEHQTLTNAIANLKSVPVQKLVN
jgi:hypothetical protein